MNRLITTINLPLNNVFTNAVYDHYMMKHKLQLYKTKVMAQRYSVLFRGYKKVTACLNTYLSLSLRG